MEDVEREVPFARPVVHRLERDQREVLVDGALGDLAVLHAVRPAPEHLTVAEVVEVGRLRLREQHDIGRSDHLGSRSDAADQRTQVVVVHAEPRAVAALEHDLLPQFGRDAVEASRVQRQAPLIRFGGRREDAQRETGREWMDSFDMNGSLVGATVAPHSHTMPRN